MRRTPLVLATLCWLSSCTAPAPRPAPGPADLPAAFYEQALKDGKPVYRVDPQQSLVVVEVRRGGTLSRLGHDHVVSARNVEGYVAPQAGRADLRVALDGLAVDEPELRKAAGFDTQPSEADIAGTRANMLDRVLETAKFPYALIRIDRPAPGEALGITMTLHGMTRVLQVPASVRIGDAQLDIAGRLELNQTDFGMTPFSILGGAIAVQDRLGLSFRIRARREPEH
jgi:hypothetical protein